MKSKLKAPGTERLKPKYDNLLSRFAFKFNLRRYNLAGLAAAAGGASQMLLATSWNAV
jgi:hypothetical protein